jgi:hypothetical protein
VHQDPAPEVERANLGGGIACVEARQPAGVPLADEHGARVATPEFERLLDFSGRQHPYGPPVERVRRNRERPEYVDDDGDAASLPCARDVVEAFNPHGVPSGAGSRPRCGPGE